jgi:hypothetical protein
MQHAVAQQPEAPKHLELQPTIDVVERASTLAFLCNAGKTQQRLLTTSTQGGLSTIFLFMIL